MTSKITRLKNTRRFFNIIQQGNSAKNTAILKRLIHSGIHINEPSPISQIMPLHAAATYGSLEIIQLLIGLGATIDARSTNNETLLHWAARRGLLEVMQLLLAKGAMIDLENNNRETPLHLAVRYNHPVIVKLLIDHHAKIDSQNWCGDTPLHLAAEQTPAIVQLLLDHGARIDIENSVGNTPLIFSVIMNNPFAVDKILLVFINKIVEGGQLNTLRQSLGMLCKREDTPLQIVQRIIACDPYHQLQLIKLIESHYIASHSPFISDAARFWQDPRKLFEIIQGAPSEEHTKAIMGSIQKYINVPYLRGYTLLHWAVEYNQPNIVRLLLDHGARPNIHDATGWTPLHLAAASGYSEIIQILLSKNININEKNRRGDTPLQIAAMRNHPKTVTLLLEKRAQIDERNNNGDTALHLAMQQGLPEIAALLLQGGAKVDIKNHTGKTALGCVITDNPKLKESHLVLENLLLILIDKIAKWDQFEILRKNLGPKSAPTPKMIAKKIMSGDQAEKIHYITIIEFYYSLGYLSEHLGTLSVNEAHELSSPVSQIVFSSPSSSSQAGTAAKPEEKHRHPKCRL
ncbi:ankyrin repeat domain-containing protein [Candidatus Berkiella aquae]|uniref:Ankyrin repeat domain-containing protein n=1 Tax=Candidatus Berkiella aquae TaxID=295108 RepID=A0A0Q9YJQ9_9GAMM|nr:ankyrin repeat domain-containing protein [Candidatus Berkiella aquae]MCS5711372.1 ankyrin repeat domain-containing protein [Candidatus Berkiella aquae]